MSDFNRSCLNEPNVFETNLHTVNVFDSCLYDTRAQGLATYNPSPGGMGGPSYDTDAAAYFSAVETAGGSFDLTAIDGTYTESYVKTAHSDFYAGLKTDGLWSKLTEFYLLVGKTFDGLTVKGKGTGTLTNNNFVSGDLLAAGAGAGLTGDGSSKILDTNSVSGGTQNDSSLSAYGTKSDTNQEGSPAIAIATDDASAPSRLTEFNNSIYLRINQSSSDISLGVFPAYFIGSRVSSNSVKTYRNGLNIVSSSVLSTTPSTNNIILFGTSYSASNATLTFAHIGTGLTDTDAENLSLRVNKLMYDLGCSTYIDSGTVAAMGLDSDVQTYANAVLTAGGNWEGV